MEEKAGNPEEPYFECVHGGARQAARASVPPVELSLWKLPQPEVPVPRESCRLPTWPPRRRLERLLPHLERWLDDPLRVERDGSGRTVWVFGAVGYRVNERLPGVYPLYRDEEGRIQVSGFTVELFRPLSSPNFLPFVLRRHGLVQGSRERAKSPGRGLLEAADSRLARNAYRVLRRDPRFEDLRARLLPEALALDPELCRIALRARCSLASCIPNEGYSTAWRFAPELRAVARESPRLLPLAATALEEGRILPGRDAVQELHRLFRYARLAPATWRYLARHGCRMLRPAWERAARGERTQGAIEFLREIGRAGHPAPPPAWAICTWLRYRRSVSRKLLPRWNPIPPEVVRIALTEAGRRRGSREEATLREDLPVVFTWAENESPRLDKLQQRAGWPWLLRKAAAAQRRRLVLMALEEGGPHSWPSAVGEVVEDGYRATALDTVEALVDEGMAFHNCIADYVADCQRGRRRLFAVSDAASGRRLAVARVDHAAEAGWRLFAVLGIANAPVHERVRAFALRLAGTYDGRMGGEAHPCEEDDFGCLLDMLEGGDGGPTGSCA